MSAVVVSEVHRGFYLDSVALMRLSKDIAGRDDVHEAALMMGTAANLQIMVDAGLLVGFDETVDGGDLLISVKAISADAADAALSDARSLLDQPSNRSDGEDWAPRTLRSAVKAVPDANLALISVPGDFAVAEARKAIRLGLHAMIFSDNVAIADEVALKLEARELGRLVMGPDCGTAIINGVPLAFANRVPRGEIAIVGASGTGTQEVSCLIAQGGGGLSQVVGVGGRDLTADVGGISTVMALELLAEDPATKHIVVVSKPPAEAVISTVLQQLSDTNKPATVCFLGSGELAMPDNAVQVSTLKAAALSALGRPVQAESAPPPAPMDAPAGRTQIRGLYSGGTLCAEAQLVLRDAGETTLSNIPIPGSHRLADNVAGHRLIDLGDDEFTLGRPHPMIDPSVRDQHFSDALNDTDVGVLLVDVVLGYGAHIDPAGFLVDTLSCQAGANRPLVVASVTGTDDDPQVRSRQVAKLESADVRVAPTNADAVAWAVHAIRSDG